MASWFDPQPDPFHVRLGVQEPWSSSYDYVWGLDSDVDLTGRGVSPRALHFRKMDQLIALMHRLLTDSGRKLSQLRTSTPT